MEELIGTVLKRVLTGIISGFIIKLLKIMFGWFRDKVKSWCESRAGRSVFVMRASDLKRKIQEESAKQGKNVDLSGWDQEGIVMQPMDAQQDSAIDPEIVLSDEIDPRIRRKLDQCQGRMIITQ